MKLKHISAALTLAVLLPFAASALTADDIQTQIQSLLAQIAQLQQQLKQLQVPTERACTMEAKICPDGSAVGRTGPNCEFAACPGTAVRPLPPVCPIFNRPLAQGATGDDVTQLQQYLGVSQTGYFGPVTAKAVGALQADAGIAQVGIVGPATRDWFWRRCGGGGWNQNFSASPTSGQAPLAVTFTANTNAKGEYSIDFGDGTSGSVWAISQIMCIRAPCVQPPPSMGHTYTANGTYTAKLIYQPPAPPCNAPPGAACMMVMPPAQVVGTVTIYVGGTTGGGAPVVTGVDGPAALNVGQTGTWTVRASVANNANTNLRYSVIWGDELPFAQIQSFANAAPALAMSGTFTHAYQSAGTFKPTFTVANDAGSAQTSASVTIGDAGGMCTAWYRICPAGTHNGGQCNQDCIPDNTSTVVFTGTLAPEIAPGYTTFRISGGDANASYSITFGDGTSGPVYPNCMMYTTNSVAGANNVVDGCNNNGQYFAQHTYASSGTYTAKLYDNRADCAAGRDCSLGTVTIIVGGSTSSAFSASPTSGPAPLGVSFKASNTDGTSAYSVSFGDGASADMMPGPIPMMACSVEGDCPVWKPYLSAYHTYSSAGTYTATLYKNSCPKGVYCFVGPLPAGTVTVTVSPAPTNAGYLNVTPRSGPAPLTVTVTTSHLPQGAGLDFGDPGGGGVACGISAYTTVGNGVPQTSPSPPPCDFTGQTHTYNTPGTYIVRISGASGTIDTVTITVTGTTNTCGDGGCGYWVPPSTYPTTVAPNQVPQSQVSTSNASPSAKYWCQAGAISVVQSTPCSAQ